MTTAARRILLVDADAFFVAVARQEDPEGAGRAALLIVGGRPGSRGVVCSASYECRAYGVRSAMSIARALQLCPNATCVPVPRGACGRRSREIQQVLALFSPVVQASSIDEWYCDMAGTEALYGHESLTETAQRIRRAVFEATGLSVSIGGGATRLVAKMAVELGKPKPGSGATGVCCVSPGDEETFLARFRLHDLPMVGPRFAETLERMGLVTVAEAQAWTRETLVARLGERAGNWMFRRVRGLDDSVVAPRETQKQVSREETFSRDLHDDALVDRELLRLAVRVSADLRKQSLQARTVTVKLRDIDFRTRSAQRTLQFPIESERSVAQAAYALLKQLRSRRRVGVRLLGISLSHFDDGPPEAMQLGLFETAPSPSGDPVEGTRDRALTRALDRIRSRYGADSILPARLIDGGGDLGPRVEE
ncbi:MAG: DNA polymerase IV [Gemmatimonas sp.]